MTASNVSHLVDVLLPQKDAIHTLQDRAKLFFTSGRIGYVRAAPPVSQVSLCIYR